MMQSLFIGIKGILVVVFSATIAVRVDGESLLSTKPKRLPTFTRPLNQPIKTTNQYPAHQIAVRVDGESLLPSVAFCLV
jgi:hypothetical protein